MAGYCQVINKLSMSMTKAQLVEGLAKNCKLSKKAVNDVLNEMAAMAYKEVKRNGEFIVPGIGKLVNREEAKIVAGVAVCRSRVAQPNDHYWEILVDIFHTASIFAILYFNTD